MWSLLFPPRPAHGKSVLAMLAKGKPLRIADLADGARGKIRGVVTHDGDAIVAPLSGRRCCAYVITIDEVGMGDSVERGVVVRGVPFALRDDSGEARIIPDGARIGSPGHVVLRLGLVFIGPVESELVSTLGVTLNYPQSSRVRFTERVIEPNSTISVLGNCAREPDPAALDPDRAGYRDEMPTRPVLSSSRRAPLLLG